MDLKKTIADLQYIRVQEILDDNLLSKIEKLNCLTDEQLWGIAPYIQHEFKQWETEAIELEKMEAERLLTVPGTDICNRQFYQSKMTDSMLYHIVSLEKYETCYYVDILESIIDEYGSDGNQLIPIITTRHPKIKLEKTVNEIIDAIFDYCVEHKIIGFTFDW